MVSGCTAVVHIQAQAKPDARAAATADRSKSGVQQGFSEHPQSRGAHQHRRHADC